jgi:hypothetical protein
MNKLFLVIAVPIVAALAGCEGGELVLTDEVRERLDRLLLLSAWSWPQKCHGKETMTSLTLLANADSSRVT